MNILFRVDSSSIIGTGHIMRDLVLAKQYKDYNIIFATQSLKGNLNFKILESGYGVEILEDNSLDEFQKIIDRYSPKLVVIDSYDIDYSYEKQLKTQNPKLKLLTFDDTYEKHYCDILLNHNISADEKKYKGLVPEYCELRCGSKYTLLRDEFFKQKNIQTIFLAMGGADHSNINIPILNVLKEFKNIEINLVTTTANQNLEELKEYVNNKDWIELHINSEKIAKLMSVSDYAIITPSVTLNEVFFMELPFLAIQTADNQEDMVQYLIENRYNILQIFNNKELKETIHNLLRPKLINFTELSLADKKMVLEWRNHLSIRKWMFTQEEITLENHLSYIDSLKTKSDRVYFLLKEQGNSIGVVDYKDIDFIKSKAFIGIYAKPNLRGVGNILMKEIINYGFFELKLNCLISEVLDSNNSAIKLYNRYGFEEIGRRDNLIIMELKHEDR